MPLAQAREVAFHHRLATIENCSLNSYWTIDFSLGISLY
jgi:hypothetical protein